ncbi:hypothetical protein FRC08_000131 [Ceratobasidium sp. 394]|nr:hypothetical protein FRC08_000131 [Ceratobasidium sp. 394]
MQCLPISNGLSGTDPTAFFLESGQTLDMGIVKLFVTTRPVSFCPLEQESPFEEGGQSNTRKVVTRFMLTDAGLWDTQSLVVVQHETLPVPIAQPSNKVTASPPLNLNPRLDTPQVSSGALQMKHCPAYDLDKDGDASQPLQVDAPLREVNSFMTVEELIACLGNRGCADITDQLNLESCTTYPLFSGGFGDVYRGKTRDGIEVAIKTMRLYVTSEGGDKKRLNRAARELYTWSRFNHPNVAKLLGLAKFRDHVGMISTWETNGSLHNYLEKRPQANRCQLSTQIAEGLGYLHQTGVVHGDLKGANVLISRDGSALLADFGNSTLQVYTLKFITSSGIHITARWAAPELLDGEGKRSIPADIYALGMTILETITSDIPYPDKGDLAVLRLVDRGVHPERPRQHIPDNCVHGERLWGLLKRCWAFEPENRPSALDVKTIITEVTDEGLKLKSA